MEATIQNLNRFFQEHQNERICVVGTTCTGKSTMIRELGYGLDMDQEIFPKLSKEETDYVCSTPWTEEIGQAMDSFVRSRLSIQPGTPLFGTVLLDCDIILYLHIDDELLLERTNSRNADFMNAKNMQAKIEAELSQVNKEVVVFEVVDERKLNK